MTTDETRSKSFTTKSYCRIPQCYNALEQLIEVFRLGIYKKKSSEGYSCTLTKLTTIIWILRVHVKFLTHCMGITNSCACHAWWQRKTLTGPVSLLFIILLPFHPLPYLIGQLKTLTNVNKISLQLPMKFTPHLWTWTWTLMSTFFTLSTDNITFPFPYSAYR